MRYFTKFKSEHVTDLIDINRNNFRYRPWCDLVKLLKRDTYFLLFLLHIGSLGVNYSPSVTLKERKSDLPVKLTQYIYVSREHKLEKETSRFSSSRTNESGTKVVEVVYSVTSGCH